MAGPGEQETGLVTIKEAARRTGLPASTIRFYDQQFEEFLAVKRGAGRRRLFTPQAVQRLLDIQRLLKDEGLSLRQTRQALAGQGAPAVPAVAAAPEAVGQVESLRAEVESLRGEVRSLERRLKDLKEIQERTLALVGSITRA
ncbi:MAG: MerR family transcriptional regulator [Desulfarculus sp.]|nr:MerR family transcriptional regulator [Desulfarculus sp.]